MTQGVQGGGSGGDDGPGADVSSDAGPDADPGALPPPAKVGTPTVPAEPSPPGGRRADPDACREDAATDAPPEAALSALGLPATPEDADNDNPDPARPLPDSGGEPRRIRETLDPWRAAALHAALDRPGPAPRAGDPLIPLQHRLFFAEASRPSALAPDGAPAPGGLWPDTGLPFRMRGGGRIDFHAPLRLGEEALRVTVVQNVALRQGGGDPVAVVTLRHEISGPEGLAVREEEDLVFRAPPAPGAPRVEPPLRDDRPAFRREVSHDATLLFRYAALTYDANRAHYDRAFAAAVGHDGLPVPAMLIAQQLADLLADRAARRLARFEYRAVAPILEGEKASLNGRTFGDRAELWALRPDGRLALEARAAFG
ncbi:MAG: hypothetical protein AAF763_14770 [Pseudomonadota bacterium]